jgi:hypothetical protein
VRAAWGFLDTRIRLALDAQSSIASGTSLDLSPPSRFCGVCAYCSPPVDGAMPRDVASRHPKWRRTGLRTRTRPRLLIVAAVFKNVAPANKCQTAGGDKGWPQPTRSRQAQHPQERVPLDLEAPRQGPRRAGHRSAVLRGAQMRRPLQRAAARRRTKHLTTNQIVAWLEARLAASSGCWRPSRAEALARRRRTG